MGIRTQPQYEEFCTECGTFGQLNDSTGWCDKCSRANGYSIAPTCQSCGATLAQGRGKLCGRCSYISWIERNADSIERIMATELVSARIAKKRVESNNRPICNSCKEPIKGGTKNRHFFCKTKPECVKAHHTYVYNRYRANKPHEESLQLAITASMIFKLTASIYSNR